MVYLRNREPGTGNPVHHQEHLPAFRRDFHAKARLSRIPIKSVLRQGWQAVDRGLGQTDTRNWTAPGGYLASI